MTDWFAQVKAWSVAEVAARFGLPVHRQGADVSFPCPACGKARRHTKGADKRNAAKVVGDGGWWCEPCEARGDAVSLAAARVTGSLKPANPEGWREVRRECAALGLCDADPSDPAAPTARKYVPPPLELQKEEAPKRAPAAEVAALWAAASALDAVPSWDEGGAWCGSARLFLADRGLSPARLAGLDVARILSPPERHAWPAWWPSYPTENYPAPFNYRVAAALYEPGGHMVAIQARTIGPEEKKTRNPSGASVRGAFFADAGGLEVLRGGSGRVVTLVEGLTDFLAAAQLVGELELGERPAVLGLVAGSAQALVNVRLNVTRLNVLTDNDETGERYFREVVKALPGASGFRVKLRPLEAGKRADLNDYLKNHPAHALAALTHGMKGGANGG